MFKSFVLCVAFIAMASALAIPYESIDGSVYPSEQLILQRVRRQTKTDYGIGSQGAFLSHTQSIVNNDKHNLGATGFVQKPLPVGPLTTGGRVDYSHKPSASELSLGASNTRGLGTDITGTGQYNFLNSRDGKGRVGAYGEYSRHLGGPSGNLKPNWGAGIRATYNF